MRKFFDPDNYLVVTYQRETAPGSKVMKKYTGCFLRIPFLEKQAKSTINNLFKEVYYNENR